MKTKHLTLGLILILSIIFVASCNKGTAIDLIEGEHSEPLTSEAQELKIEIATPENYFYITNINACDWDKASGRVTNIIDLRGIEHEKIVKGFWFEVMIADDMKSITVKLDKNTVTLHRTLKVVLSNGLTENPIWVLLEQEPNKE